MGLTALHYAASLEYIGIIELLIENGVDVNIKDNDKSIEELTMFTSLNKYYIAIYYLYKWS